jgi:ABC-type branched-subunit amino acid transport system ATPase component
MTGSPLGRALRAVRENEDAAAALGKNTRRLRLLVFVVGGGIAGVSGAVLVQFIGTWAPGSWLYPETFTLLTAIIVGGAGNNFGVMVGALCVPIVFLEAPRFLPQVGRLGLIDALQWIAVGLLALLFLWFRPQGLIPERKRRFPIATDPSLTEAPDTSADREEIGAFAPASAEGSLLALDNVRREFGGVTAVDGVSFEVSTGGITGVIGPNGAGKSTLVNLISGFLKPSAGSIRFAGREIAGRPAHVVARHGVIRTFQLSSEFGRMTVLENLVTAARGQHGEGFWGAILPRRVWAREERATVDRARQLLSDFHLEDKENSYAGELSGGERRLVEIARAVMAKPRLLLLDEPTSGVQPAMVRRLEQHLQALREQGVTIVVIEHELDVLERICDSVVVMARGTVLARGTMAELRKKREVMEAYVVG